MTNDADVIVVGAGLAGLRAARDLAEQGRRVLVLESRDRVGGRGWTSTFPGTDVPVEMGGAWFTPRQPLAAAEIERYGIGVRTFEPVTHTRWLTDGQLRMDAPFPPDDARCVAQWQRVQDDAAAMAAGVDDVRWALSLDDYLASIDAAPAIADLLYGWWSITGGGSPARGCIEGVLFAIAYEGPVGDMGYLRYAPAAGWSALAEAMAATPGIDLRLETRVAEVVQDDDGVTVVTEQGRHRTGAAVVAVPVNALPQIGFNPPPPARTAQAFGMSMGKAFKVWLLARGV
ncbi:MAG: FAD-dependent oxidoreductase, partial [Actinomycetes bacterium]